MPPRDPLTKSGSSGLAGATRRGFGASSGTANTAKGFGGGPISSAGGAPSGSTNPVYVGPPVPAHPGLGRGNLRHPILDRGAARDAGVPEGHAYGRPAFASAVVAAAHDKGPGHAAAVVAAAHSLSGGSASPGIARRHPTLVGPPPIVDAGGRVTVANRSALMRHAAVIPPGEGQEHAETGRGPNPENHGRRVRGAFGRFGDAYGDRLDRAIGDRAQGQDYGRAVVGAGSHVTEQLDHAGSVRAFGRRHIFRPIGGEPGERRRGIVQAIRSRFGQNAQGY